MLSRSLRNMPLSCWLIKLGSCIPISLLDDQPDSLTLWHVLQLQQGLLLSDHQNCVDHHYHHTGNESGSLGLETPLEVSFFALNCCATANNNKIAVHVILRSLPRVVLSLLVMIFFLIPQLECVVMGKEFIRGGPEWEIVLWVGYQYITGVFVINHRTESWLTHVRSCCWIQDCCQHFVRHQTIWLFLISF